MKSISETLTALNSFVKIAEEQEKIFIPVLQVKLAKAQEEYPEDFTIGSIRDVISRIASKSNSKLFITRGELKELYKNSYSRNNKFIHIFAEELGAKELPEQTRTAPEDNQIDLNEAFSEHIDPVLAHNLAIQFGSEKNAYTKNSAVKAVNMCNDVLSLWNIPVKSIKVASGNLETIVCECNFDTPKGNTTFFVPVSIAGKDVEVPSLFVGNNGPEDFNSSNIKNYVFKNAGIKLANVNANQILEAIASINDNEISQVDLAYTKLKSASENNGQYYANSILGQEVEEEVKDIREPQYFDPEVQSFAKSLENPNGIAVMTFGKDKVERARKIISNKVKLAGYPSHKINVLDSDNDKTVFAVSVANTSFRVPVKMSNSLFDVPVMVANGSIMEFEADNIQSVVNDEVYDTKASVVNSTSGELSTAELVETVRVAMVENNLAKAEDALNVLAESGDKIAYASAFQAFQDGLNGAFKKEASNKCSNVIKTANSKHLICGHTGLPVHKVYQDEQGNCCPLYRKSMDDASVAGYFLNHKVFI